MQHFYEGTKTTLKLLTLFICCFTSVNSMAEGQRVAPGPLQFKVTSGGKAVANAKIELGARYCFTGPKGVAIMEGVPAGDYECQIKDIRYNSFSRKIKLNAGTRKAQVIDLKSITYLKLTGKVKDKLSGELVPGARIELRPVAIPANLQGNYNLNTDFKGNFSILRIPAGKWQVTVTLGGYKKAVHTVELKSTTKNLDLTVEREFSIAALRINVKEFGTGKTVSGAKVTLCEAYPVGKLTEIKTDRAGNSIFRNLKVGLSRFDKPTKNVLISRELVNVTVTAKGYGRRQQAVRLQPNGVVNIQLYPIKEIKEVEPNNTISTAQNVDPGTSVAYQISPVRDYDYFKFSLKRTAMVTIHSTAVNGETHMSLTNNEGKSLRNSGSSRGRENKMSCNLSAGTYYVRMEEWGNNAVVEPAKFTITAVEVDDPYEPNQSKASARVLKVGSTTRGYIFPTRDFDHYRFELKRPSRCLIKLGCPKLEVYLNVYNDQGKNVGSLGVSAGRISNRELQLPPGRYTIKIEEWGNNNWSDTPYELTIDCIGDDNIDDPKPQGNKFQAVRHLPFNTLNASTTLPIGDHDYFKQFIPSKGMLRVHILAPLETYLHIRNKDGKSLGSFGASANRYTKRDVSFTKAGSITIDVEEWGNNNYSASPYLLWTEFFPSDEQDMLGDDSRQTATPMEFGQTYRNTIYPIRDQDWYQIQVDHHGTLEWWLDTTVEQYLYVYKEGRKAAVFSRGISANRKDNFKLAVTPGIYYAHLQEWGNNGQRLDDYRLKTELHRADKRDLMPLATPNNWQLAMNRAEPFGPELLKDIDAFTFAVQQKGDYKLLFNVPLEVYAHAYDARTGKRVFSAGIGACPTTIREYRFKAKGPTNYRMTIGEWGNNGSTAVPGFVMLTTVDKKVIPAVHLKAVVDPINPTKVTFTATQTTPTAGVKSIQLDINGDGKIDTPLSLNRPVTVQYPTEGLYYAKAYTTGTGGATAHTYCWVHAQGQHEKKGVYLNVFSPAPGELVDKEVKLKCRVLSYEGTKIRAVSASIGGRLIATSYRAPFEMNVPWEKLNPGPQQLTLTAVDFKGNRKVVKHNVIISEFFNLLPEDGATRTGNNIRISWSSSKFVPTMVRYRQEGEKTWKEAVGQSGRNHSVRLPDMEAGKVYEYQALGRAPGPLRKITRMKGLAFGELRYGANIKRDYDQRVGISVRNHSEKEMDVLLTCGKPNAYDNGNQKPSKLLIGFVGEGSEGVPFKLKPGEEREFLLGLSAQDVVKEDHRFAVRIVSPSGYSDEAEVQALVKLPVVKFEWKDMGPTADKTGHKFQLINKGDTLTDLDLLSETEGLTVSPAVHHGLFKANQRLDVVASPVLCEGYKSIEGSLIAKALDKTLTQVVSLELPDGEQVFGVQLIPGFEEGAEMSGDDLKFVARSIAGAYLDAEDVDWSTKGNPRDSNEDGKVDRWDVIDDFDNTTWTGEDNNGDGQIDFAFADIGTDGQVEYAAYKTETGWEQTNLVEVWLEMGFSLPWNRSAYTPHDLELVVNGTSVANITQSIPEGNYRFKLPPTVVKFTPDGTPEESNIEIRSKHLRGGHYVVNSDFRFKLRMTGTRAYVIGKTGDEARKKLTEHKEINLAGPDYSVSSDELKLIKPRKVLKMGDQVTIEIPLRNIGAGRSRNVAVALQRAVPGGKGVELIRKYVYDVPLTGSKLVKLNWKVAAGSHSLKVVVDPDKETADESIVNNEAIISFTVPGNDAKPTIKLDGKADIKLDTPVLEISGTATDDSGITRVQLRVDRGLWQTLDGYETFNTKVLLQPGRHTVEVRATDSGGQHVVATIRANCDVKVPEIKILTPKSNAKIDAMSTTVVVSTGEEAIAVAGRYKGGAWVSLTINDEKAEGNLPIEFGSGKVEVMVVTKSGVQKKISINIQGIKQPEEVPEEDEEPDNDGKDSDDAKEEKADDKKDRRPAKEIQKGKDKATEKGKKNNKNEDNKAVKNKGEKGTKGEKKTPKMGGDKKAPTKAGGKEAGKKDSDTSDDVEPYKDPSKVDIPGFGEINPFAGENPVARTPQTQSRRAPSKSSYSRSRGKSRSSGGGFIGVKKRRKNWYCTNRPNINTKFKLPDWLRRKKMPKPGTKEFKAMKKKLLAMLKKRGIDTSKLEKFQKYLMKKAGSVEQPGDLPGFWESLGFSTKVPTDLDEVQLKLWRKKMQHKTDAWFLRLLASGDPKMIAEGLGARAKAFGKFDQAMQDHADAVIQTVEANQKVTEDLASGIPLVGDAMDLVSAVTGETLSGEKLSGWQRVFAAVAVIGPEGLEMWLKNKAAAKKTLEAIAETADQLDGPARKILAKKLGMSADKLDDALDAVKQVKSKVHKEALDKVDDLTKQGVKNFDNTKEGLEAAKDFAKSQKHSMNKLDDMNKVLKKFGPDSKEFRKAMMDVQADKMAQNVLANGVKKYNDLPPSIRKSMDEDTFKALSKTMKDKLEGKIKYINGNPERVGGIYGKVDDVVCDGLKKSDEVKDLAKKHKLKNVEVEPLKISHAKADDIKIGRDRDVTYQLVGETADGKKVKIDIDHKVAEDKYKKAFHDEIHGELPKGTSKADADKIYNKTIDKFDQTVTSKAHLEAYNVGDVPLDEFLKHGTTPKITHIGDVADTFVHKSDIWFKKAKKATTAAEKSKNMAEGMRQASKQWDNEVMTRVNKFFPGDAARKVHPNLVKTAEIFKKVEDLKISPAQAEAMIKNLPGAPSVQSMVKKMGGFLEATEKFAGKSYRAMQKGKLSGAVKKLTNSVGDTTKAISMINKAMKNGNIEPTVFMKLRSDVLAKMLSKGTQRERLLRRSFFRTARQNKLISAKEEKEYLQKLK